MNSSISSNACSLAVLLQGSNEALKTLIHGLRLSSWPRGEGGGAEPGLPSLRVGRAQQIPGGSEKPEAPGTAGLNVSGR